MDAQGYHLHPILLDGAFQSLLASVDDGPRADLIPVGIDRIHFFGDVSSNLSSLLSHGRITGVDADEVRGDITLLSEDGTVIAEVTGFTCRGCDCHGLVEIGREYRLAARRQRGAGLAFHHASKRMPCPSQRA